MVCKICGKNKKLKEFRKIDKTHHTAIENEFERKYGKYPNERDLIQFRNYLLSKQKTQRIEELIMSCYD